MPLALLWLSAHGSPFVHDGGYLWGCMGPATSKECCMWVLWFSSILSHAGCTSMGPAPHGRPPRASSWRISGEKVSSCTALQSWRVACQHHCRCCLPLHPLDQCTSLWACHAADMCGCTTTATTQLRAGHMLCTLTSLQPGRHFHHQQQLLELLLTLLGW